MPALDGLRVLDMTQYEAGPSCTQTLAWLGADVVKIEPPGTGDPGRCLLTRNTNYSIYFCNWNANKRSVSLDLTKPEGRGVFLRMLPQYDVFVENYGPGVVDRFELDYETLREVHPGLIYATVKGFGTSGPYSDYLAYDQIVQAAAGAFSMTGEADGPPMCPGSTTADSGTGAQLSTAILAAYIQKLRTGQGQHVELSMQEAMTYYMRTMFSFRCDFGREVPPRAGNSRGAPPTNLYPCKPFGPNDYAYIMTITDRHWDRMCEAMERMDLIADPRFVTSRARVENGEALFGEISAWTRERTKHQVMETLARAKVPCAAVLDARDVHHDPHLEARGFIQNVDLPEHGRQRMLGLPARLAESPVEMRPAPQLGEHSDEVLAQDLGLSAADLRALREAGALA